MSVVVKVTQITENVNDMGEIYRRLRFWKDKRRKKEPSIRRKYRHGRLRKIPVGIGYLFFVGNLQMTDQGI